MESLNILPKNWGKKGERTEGKGQRKKYSIKHRKEKKNTSELLCQKQT